MSQTNFDAFAFSKQPNYDEKQTRAIFAQAVPLKTVVVYCYDPRAVGIPSAVAEELGEEFPGRIVLDAAGNKAASTANLFEVIVAGGRAIDALRSVTVAQHLFGIEAVVVVHHSHCGATSFTADGIVEAYQQEHGVDIAGLYPQESVCIADYQESLLYDVDLLRQSPGTPQHVNIYGYFYDIDQESLTKVVENPGVANKGVNA
ncbi:MAG: carbonic anhydrase [Pseudomonadota bacterium]